MEVKTYRVRSVAEALPLIARELGPEAAVLHTRQLPRRWHQWLVGPQWEVVAGLDPEVPERFVASLRSARLLEPLSSQPTSEAAMASSIDSTSGAARESLAERWPSLAGDERTVSESTPAVSERLRQRWRELGVAPAAVECMWQDWRLASLDVGPVTDDVAWQQLRQRFAEVIALPGELRPTAGRCRRAALVGPTGVGKTTTVAKLAADFQLRQGCQVGLITVDTFRVGAVEQLQAYADILQVPMRVVSNVEQMRLATAELQHCDWVLIDTIGRSPRDWPRIEALQEILQAAELDHLLLTLSASSDPRMMAAALHAFVGRGPNDVGWDGPNLAAETALILTKIDECQTLAPLYPLLRDSGLPWRYWTHGQNVPEDLGVAADDVVAWFLDEIQWGDLATGES